MSPRPTGGIARVGRVALALLALAHLGVAGDREGTLIGMRAALSERLERRSQDAERVLAERFASLGEEAVPTLFDVYLGEVEVDAPEEAVARWIVGQDRVGSAAGAALLLVPRDAVIEELERYASPRVTTERRTLAMRVLGELASGDAIPPLLALLESHAPVERRHRSVAEPARLALTRILTEDPLSTGRLQTELDALSPDTLEIVAQSLRDAGRPACLRVLADLVGRDPRLDLQVLEAIGEAVQRSPWQDEIDAAALFKKQLATRTDPERQRLLLVLLGRVHALDAVEDLLDALDSPDPRLSRAARWSLERMAGTRLPVSSSEWRGWVRFEERWWAHRGRELVAGFGDATPAELAAMARELAEHPLYRHAIADELGQHVFAREVAVATTACETLERLGSGLAVPALVDALGSPGDEVRDAAWSALRRITGREIPADREAWLSYVTP